MCEWDNIDKLKNMVELCVVPKIGNDILGTHCFTNYAANSISSHTIRESISHLAEYTASAISYNKLYQVKNIKQKKNKKENII